MSKRRYRVVVNQPLPEGGYIARLGISVGGERHEGGEFYALASYLSNSSNVKAIVIEVCCTLQRHNYQVDGVTDSRSASRMAQQFGDEWLRRNEKAIRLLKDSGKPFTIRRWSEWLGDPGYKSAQDAVNRFVEGDAGFRAAVEKSVEVFSARFKARHEKLRRNNAVLQMGAQGHETSGESSSAGPDSSAVSELAPINQKALRECCRRYLLEECAVIMNLWAKDPEGACVLFYPANMTAALKKAYEAFVSPGDQFSWVKYSTRKVKVRQNQGQSVAGAAVVKRDVQEVSKSLSASNVAELFRGISLADIPAEFKRQVLETMCKQLATSAMADTHANSSESSTGSISASNSEEDSSSSAENTPPGSPLLAPKVIKASSVKQLDSPLHRSTSPAPEAAGVAAAPSDHT